MGAVASGDWRNEGRWDEGHLLNRGTREWRP